MLDLRNDRSANTENRAKPMPASRNEMNTLIARQVVYLGAGMKVQRLRLLPNQRTKAFASEYVAQGQTHHDQQPE